MCVGSKHLCLESAFSLRLLISNNMADFFAKNKFEIDKIKYFFISYEFSESNSYCFVVTYDGLFYSCGENQCGQLGLGDNEEHDGFHVVEELCREVIGEIDEIYEATVVTSLKLKKVIFMVGVAINGLNLVSVINRHHLTMRNRKIKFWTNVQVKHIKCGSWHNLALSEHGKVYGWGKNKSKQISSKFGKLVRYPLEIEISENTPVISIYCYDNTSIIIDSEKQVYFAGEDNWGVLNCKNRKKFPCLIENFYADAIELNEYIYFLQKGHLYKFNHEVKQRIIVDEVIDINYDREI